MSSNYLLHMPTLTQHNLLSIKSVQHLPPLFLPYGLERSSILGPGRAFALHSGVAVTSYCCIVGSESHNITRSARHHICQWQKENIDNNKV